MATTDPLTERRQAAQQAMEGEEHRLARAAKLADLEKRRLAARNAMEGEERRQRREAKERLERDRRLTLEQRTAAAQGAAAAQASIAREAEAAKAQAERDATAAKTRRVEAIGESEALIEKMKTDQLNLSPLRTFKTDMERAVQEGISVSRMALAEQARGQAAPVAAAPAGKSHAIWLVLLLIIIAAGAGGAYWWYFVKAPATTAVLPTTPPPALPNFIFTEMSQPVPLGGTATDLLQTINTEFNENDLVVKAVKYLYFESGGELVPWNTFRQAINLHLPDGLARSLSAQFMFGAYNDGSGNNKRFLILKTNDYALAYANLLSWENTMADDLLPLLRGNNPTGAERTASFSDRLVRNKDARVLAPTLGQTALFYSFLDPQTIVITTDEATFLEIFNRYTQGNPASTITQ